VLASISSYDAAMRFKSRLEAAFLRRKDVNPSYSLRAFARALKADHATLSQILRGRRRVTAKTIRAWGSRLGLSASDVCECCCLENEASILGAIKQARFRANSRWLAVTLNIPLDDVNIALQRLLHKRLLRMCTHGSWQGEESHG
jgi:transcriptional regulator with XRE-family HTH domain